MIELRADGSIPGKPAIGRIYKMVGSGKLNYQYFTCERESDWPKYIQDYSNFRGFVTGFIPVAELNLKLAELKNQGFTEEEAEVEWLAHMKAELIKAHKEASDAAYRYFVTCPGGPEREKAVRIMDKVNAALDELT